MPKYKSYNYYQKTVMSVDFEGKTKGDYTMAVILYNPQYREDHKLWNKFCKWIMIAKDIKEDISSELGKFIHRID